ncbi:MAG TPA: VOC family protein [Acidimicrobiia bacterium]|nr:VOC family protein [Acidimicrobiia bacterium]
MVLEVDHVIVRVDDLDEAAVLYREDIGLGSVRGGRHPGHGTANRVIPLGDAYIELVTVVDPAEAEGSWFGRWVAQPTGEILSFDALCLRSDDLDGVCAELGLEAFGMSRRLPDGFELRWRMAGVERALRDRIPFFIQWDVPLERFPGRQPVEHPDGRFELDEVILGGDTELLQRWAGEARGVRYEDAEPGIIALTLRGGDGVITALGDAGA